MPRVVSQYSPILQYKIEDVLPLKNRLTRDESHTLEEAMNSGQTWQLGSTGPDVGILFVMTKLPDYNGIDGNFRPQTQDAVKSFQQSNNLTAAGVVGPETSPYPLQKALASYGSPNTPTDPGPVDGDFGPKTESAVRAHQTDRGVAADGVGSSPAEPWRSSLCRARVIVRLHAA